MSQVLIIDDSPTAVEKARRALVSGGHQVDSLTKMIELGGRLRTSPPELVLLDLNMPGLSGEGFATLINRFSSGRIPIVIYSSEDRSKLASVAKRLEASAWVHKSEVEQDLLRTVDRVLAAARSSSAPGGEASR
jgi:CheY-like chemotaxis protein